jgi:hypothetical protein
VRHHKLSEYKRREMNNNQFNPLVLLVTKYLAEFKTERVATLMQSVVRSWLIRRRWRMTKVKALTTGTLTFL